MIHTTPVSQHYGGILLLGGESRRMGQSKALLPFPDGPLWQRVLKQMCLTTELQVIVAGKTQSTAYIQKPSLPASVLVTQDQYLSQGPLVGLLAGFRALQHKAGAILVVPVDMPYFTAEWMHRLLGAHQQTAAVCEWEGIKNALLGCYSASLLPKIERLVDEGSRRPVAILEGESIDVYRPSLGDSLPQSPHPCMDVDTPAAYRDALLQEGVGISGAPAITVHWAINPDNHLVQQWTRTGFIPLYADSAEVALQCSHRLLTGQSASLPWLYAHAYSLERTLLGGNRVLPTSKKPLRESSLLTAGDQLLLQF